MHATLSLVAPYFLAHTQTAALRSLSTVYKAALYRVENIPAQDQFAIVFINVVAMSLYDISHDYVVHICRAENQVKQL